METSEKKNKLSRFLQNLANFCQVLLVGLAFFGYFYTVRPIYQKELLEEDIAKKELQLKEQEKGVEQAKREKTMLINEDAFLNKQNREMRLAVEGLSKEKESMDNQIARLKASLSMLNSSYDKIRTDLRINVMTYFGEHIKIKLPRVPGYLGYADFHFKVENPFAWYDWDRHEEPTPEKVIMEAFADFQQYKLLDDQDRKAFISCVNTYLQSHPQEVRKQFNLAKLFNDYKRIYEKVRGDFDAGKYKFGKSISMSLSQADLEKHIKEVDNDLRKEFQRVVEDLSSQREALESVTLTLYREIADSFIKGIDCSR